MASLLKHLLVLGTFQFVALSGILVIVVGVLILYITTLCYPANMPRIYEDEKATRFRLKTRLNYYVNCKEMFRETYEKVCHGLNLSSIDYGLMETSTPNTAKLA